MPFFFSKLQNAAKTNAMKIQYIACPNQQVGVIVAKIHPADLKKIDANASSGENLNGGMDKEKILSKLNSSITHLGFFRSVFKRGPKETLLAMVEHEDAKWRRSKGCGFTEADQRILEDCQMLLKKMVHPELKTGLGPRPPAPPKVPVIKSHREGGEDKVGAKKPENGNGSRNVNGCENVGAAASREGATGGSGNGGVGKPDGGDSGDDGGNGSGVTEGGGEDGVLGKLMEKLNEVFGG